MISAVQFSVSFFNPLLSVRIGLPQRSERKGITGSPTQVWGTVTPLHSFTLQTFSISFEPNGDNNCSLNTTQVSKSFDSTNYIN